MKISLLCPLLCIMLTCCNTFHYKEKDFSVAIENGNLANEAYVRSLKCVNAWMDRRDSASGLIPTNLTGKKDLWEPFNSAADNYAFMVLTSFLLDRDMYDGPMLEMLNSEEKLTSRLKSLPDVYRFSTRKFNLEKIDTAWVLFGTSEYIKDGLIPLTEFTGSTPWSKRMMEMLNDLQDYYTVLKNLDQMEDYKAVSEEINGSMLQTLSRVYWMTGDEKYLDWAIKIGDYYLLENRDLSRLEYLRLRDHGCEIIGGLSELYVTLNFARPEKKALYTENLYRVLDRILAVGRNKDGLFYNSINALTGIPVDSNVVDCWGYIFDAYYSVYLIDKKEEYRQAFLDGIKNLNEKYTNFRWEGSSHDGYADAIESGINLYNREPVPSLKKWIDSEMRVMMGMQKENGIIGGAHPDGNFERTAIMYGLWKTMGLYCVPWREDLKLGSELKKGKLFITVSADTDWSGKVFFDYNRHKENLNLPIDYPRINQFPEWFTADNEKEYIMTDFRNKLRQHFTGSELKSGIELKVTGGERSYFLLSQAGR